MVYNRGIKWVERMNGFKCIQLFCYDQFIKPIEFLSAHVLRYVDHDK